MKQQSIKQQIADSVLLFDGAMGTMLQGRYEGHSPELLNIKNPKLIEDIHRAYLAAGSDIITANTFGANQYKLEGSGYSVEDVVKAGVRCARSAGAKYVALDIGPTGQLLKPTGTLLFESAVSAFYETITAGAAAGADLVLIETMSDLYEMKAAVVAAKEASKLPIVASMSFDSGGRTFMGCDAQTAAVFLSAIGVDAIGVNCSQSPSAIAFVVDALLQFSRVPVLVMPNAGLPQTDADGKDCYPVAPKEFAETLFGYYQKGARLFGGCCGTTPKHIAALKRLLGQAQPLKCQVRPITAVTSGTKTVVMDGRTTMIGERLNPTGKPKLKDAIRSGNYVFLISEAAAQAKAGAHILDVNCGLPELDEPAVLARCTEELQAVIDLPLQIDSADSLAVERAVRLYNGKPLINSVNGAPESMETIFPIAKRYGAAVVGLTLDRQGIPKKAEERFKIAERIVKTAAKYGIAKEDIVIDCLVLTASAQQDEVMETVKAVRLVKEKLGVRTVLGVSNVSYGLPERAYLNSVFLTAALTAGLDAAIVNPLSDEIQNAIKAFGVLSGADRGADAYIAHFAKTADSASPFSTVKAAAHPERNAEGLSEFILSGRREDAVLCVKELLKTTEPLAVINSRLVPALNEAGAMYQSGKLFLPQLIAAAEAAKSCFECVKERLPVRADVARGKVLLATVKGDIHDIGKNIVKVLLQSYGFEVLDLGRDVDGDTVAQAAKMHGIRLVGLSALMTTTIPAMKETVQKLRTEAPGARIMVGGAVLNSDYAGLVGADDYAPDAMAGVKIAQEVFLKK